STSEFGQSLISSMPKLVAQIEMAVGQRWLVLEQTLEKRAKLLIPRKTANRIAVEALADGRWMRDIHGTLTWQILQDPTLWLISCIVNHQ
ncbi:hypothetical protein ACJX0J_028790, partial [Zea mays]